MSRRQFLAASITASLAAIALARTARTAPVPAGPGTARRDGSTRKASPEFDDRPCGETGLSPPRHRAQLASARARQPPVF